MASPIRFRSSHSHNLNDPFVEPTMGTSVVVSKQRLNYRTLALIFAVILSLILIIAIIVAVLLLHH